MPLKNTLCVVAGNIRLRIFFISTQIFLVYKRSCFLIQLTFVLPFLFFGGIAKYRFGPKTTYTICLYINKFRIQTHFFRLRKNDRNVYNSISGDIDAYTGGLAELPVEGGLVRFLFISFLWTDIDIYRTQEILSEKWLDALNPSL